MIGPFAFRQFPPWEALAGRATAPLSVLAVAVTECLEAVRDAAREGTPVRAAPLAVLFRDFAGDPLTFDALAPVESSIGPSPAGDGHRWLRLRRFDGGLAATTGFAGPMDTIPLALEALGAWIRAQGLVSAGFPFQFHHDDPGESFERGLWHTELAWFVAGEDGFQPAER